MNDFPVTGASTHRASLCRTNCGESERAPRHRGRAQISTVEGAGCEASWNLGDGFPSHRPALPHWERTPGSWEDTSTSSSPPWASFPPCPFSLPPPSPGLAPLVGNLGQSSPLLLLASALLPREYPTAFIYGSHPLPPGPASSPSLPHAGSAASVSHSPAIPQPARLLSSKKLS